MFIRIVILTTSERDDWRPEGEKEGDLDKEDAVKEERALSAVSFGFGWGH